MGNPPKESVLRTAGFITGAYGICVVGSGLWRFFGSEGGHTGLIFGLVMGAVALVAAGLFAARKNLAAFGLAWLTVAFVGGWFVYEALIKKGLSNAEPRQLIIIGISCITAGILIRSGLITR